MNKLSKLFGGDGIQNLLDTTQEMISVKAHMNDTGTGSATFGSVVDFPDPDIVCVQITGDKAIELWTDAVEAFVKSRISVADQLLSGIPDLEVKPGAAIGNGDAPTKLEFNPWKYTRGRRS